MRELVIVPTFDRPEYLWNTLENLYNCPSCDADIWVCEDIHADKPKHFTTQMEMLATIREWEKKFNSRFRYFAMAPHTTYGNSYCVLMNLAHASTMSYDHVHLIEDDVMVTDDYFWWADEVMQQFSPWVACAGRLNRSLNFAMNGPEAIDETVKDTRACHKSITAYNSWATCFSKEALYTISTMAGGFEFARPGREQDIAIQDMLRRNKFESIWPYVPRAYHLGWYSYHRDGMRFNGTLEEKVKALQAAVRDPEKIRSMASIQQIDAFPKQQPSYVAGTLCLR